MLSGRDTLVVLPTGGGKSLCYQVPAMVLPGLTVVVSPLISLMKDQVDALTARGIPATFVNSTLSSGEVSERMTRVMRREVKLLYVAPERFDVGTAAERLREVGVSLLAIDEAHCISEWGHDFRPSYLRIAQVRERLGWPQTVALTATATPHVRQDIARQLRLEDPETIITGFDRQNLRYHVVPTRSDAEKDAALAGILRDHQEGVAIVYASTRRNVEKIARTLEDAGIAAAAYHAGLDDAHRHEVQDAFMSERVRAIVATNAFGMGIDKPNVRVVVHHAMPGTLEAYYQEAGRAGRDGQPAEVYLLHAFPDRFTHEFFIKGAHPERALVEKVYDACAQDGRPRGRRRRSSRERSPPRCRGRSSDREVESALRLLIQVGALRSDPESGGRVFVRLLATADRIKRELGAERRARARPAARALARRRRRALRRRAGRSRRAPAGLRRRRRRDAAARRSSSAAQFLEWHRLGGGDHVTDPRRPLSAYPLDWAALERRRKSGAREARRDAAVRVCDAAAGAGSCCATSAILPPARTAAGATTASAPTTRRGARRRRPRPSPARSVALAAIGAATEPEPSELVASPADARLLERLRALRTSIAREEQVPAYIVFADRTLLEIAVRRPKSPYALGEIRGVGR